MYATLQCLAGLAQPARFCMRARVVHKRGCLHANMLSVFQAAWWDPPLSPLPHVSQWKKCSKVKLTKCSKSHFWTQSVTVPIPVFRGCRFAPVKPSRLQSVHRKPALVPSAVSLSLLFCRCRFNGARKGFHPFQCKFSTLRTRQRLRPSAK